MGSDSTIVADSDALRTTSSYTFTTTTSTIKEVENLIDFSIASMAKNSSGVDNDLSLLL